ncbi:MAG: DNA polymerase I [Desulfovibrio sp.]|nr:DNA polymerase I [Desulfovibrio sp.]
MSLKERLCLQEEPLFLMDGTAFIYRAFFTGRNMQRSDGFPTNVLVGISRLLLRILREEKPLYFLFVRDGHGKNFRHEIYPEYKANRDATPEDLVRQIEPVCRMVTALGFRDEETQGFEADDCMASLAARFSAERPVIIISGDKDLKQCLAPNVYIWNLAAKEEVLLSQADFQAENSITPENWPDLQAIVGDSADNIPGVPGIGPKTALKIFSYCSSLEDIRDHLEKLPPKLALKMQPHLEDMFTWRKLTRLSLDYPGEFVIDDFKVGPMDAGLLRALAKEYELVALMREIEFMLMHQGERQPVTAPRAAQSASSQSAPLLYPGAIKISGRKVSLATELPQLQAHCVALIDERRGGGKALHVAVCGYDQATGTFQASGSEPWAYEELVWQGKTADLLTWLCDASKIVVADLKPFYKGDAAVANFFAEHVGRVLDLGLACYLLRPEDRDFSWENLESHWAGSLQDGNLGSAGLALKLAKSLEARLEENGLRAMYQKLELPLVRVLAAMESVGIAIDRQAFAKFLEEVQQDLDGLTEKVYALTGMRFNLRSAQQLGDVLSKTLKLSLQGKTKGGQMSTSQQNLEKLEGAHPVILPILQFRKLEKIRSTYLDPLPKLVDAQGRLHTTFEQKATATGRLASRDPNLQNIPARGALGKRMRTCFIAAPHMVLISSDYSQIELRMLAHMSQDNALLSAFREGLDIHAHTASLIYDLPMEKISKDQRRNAKTINFGLIYGMGALKLAQELKVSLNEAKTFIASYFSRLGGLKAFYDGVVQEAKRTGYVLTLGGRRRNLPDIFSANTSLSSQAQRQAINTVIQGSAADVIKMAMLNVAKDQELQAMGARLLLQVHDELLVEVPENYAQEAGERVAQLMQAVRFGEEALLVPLVADWGYGANWGEAH